MGRTAAGPVDENGSKISQKALVQLALDDLGMDAMPDAINGWIKDKYNGYDLPKGPISTYKSIIKGERGGSKTSKKQKKTKSAKLPSEKSSVNTASSTDGPSVASLLEFVSVIRDFEAKFGYSKVREIVEAVQKSKV